MGKSPCCDKDNGLKKGPWTPEEDQKLIDYIKKQGHGRWRTLPKNAGLKRCGKSCRLRWTNYLRPDIKRGRFSFEEEETIIQLHSVLGNKWSAIATRLPGRTDNEIKNYWNTHIRKRLMKMGIDPVTHTPRLDLLELSLLLNSTLYNSSSSTSHVNNNQAVPNYFLGNNMEPLVNQNLLNLATTLLSYQPKPSTSNITSTSSATTFVPQISNIQENLGVDQIVPQSQYQSSFQQNHFCTTSSTDSNSVNETQFMQAKLEQLMSQSLMGSFSTISTTNCTSCPNNNNVNSSTNLWQNNNVSDVQDHQALITSAESFVANNNNMTSTNIGHHDSTHSSPIINSSLENQAFVSCKATNNIVNTSFSSLLSTPSSSPYVNYSSSTTNTTHEDEKDSFCSNIFMYDIANFAFSGNEFV